MLMQRHTTSTGTGPDASATETPGLGRRGDRARRGFTVIAAVLGASFVLTILLRADEGQVRQQADRVERQLTNLRDRAGFAKAELMLHDAWAKYQAATDDLLDRRIGRASRNLRRAQELIDRIDARITSCDRAGAARACAAEARAAAERSYAGVEGVEDWSIAVEHDRSAGNKFALGEFAKAGASWTRAAGSFTVAASEGARLAAALAEVERASRQMAQIVELLSAPEVHAIPSDLADQAASLEQELSSLAQRQDHLEEVAAIIRERPDEALRELEATGSDPGGTQETLAAADHLRERIESSREKLQQEREARRQRANAVSASVDAAIDRVDDALAEAPSISSGTLAQELVEPAARIHAALNRVHAVRGTLEKLSPRADSAAVQGTAKELAELEQRSRELVDGESVESIQRLASARESWQQKLIERREQLEAYERSLAPILGVANSLRAREQQLPAQSDSLPDDLAEACTAFREQVHVLARFDERFEAAVRSCRAQQAIYELDLDALPSSTTYRHEGILVSDAFSRCEREAKLVFERCEHYLSLIPERRAALERRVSTAGSAIVELFGNVRPPIDTGCCAPERERLGGIAAELEAAAVELHQQLMRIRSFPADQLATLSALNELEPRIEESERRGQQLISSRKPVIIQAIARIESEARRIEQARARQKELWSRAEAEAQWFICTEDDGDVKFEDEDDDREDMTGGVTPNLHPGHRSQLRSVRFSCKDRKFRFRGGRFSIRTEYSFVADWKVCADCAKFQEEAFEDRVEHVYLAAPDRASANRKAAQMQSALATLLKQRIPGLDIRPEDIQISWILPTNRSDAALRDAIRRNTLGGFRIRLRRPCANHPNSSDNAQHSRRLAELRRLFAPG